MLYGDKIAEVKISNIKVYEGKQREDTLVIVDLGENDYAFELDFEIKPTSKEYAEELCEYVGTYDEETGLVSQKQAYGVMRYNVISKGYDVTAIELIKHNLILNILFHRSYNLILNYHLLQLMNYHLLN